MTSEYSLAGRVVSRETWDRLKALEGLLRKWTKAINLVSPGTLDTIWTRHFADSAQIFDMAPDRARSWADLGSGGGFPGLVVAILAKDESPGLSVTLVESDQRKAAFLMTAARTLDLRVTVVADRIESVAPLGAKVLSARALAPLDVLLGYAERHLNRAGVAIFPKGATVDDELAHALEHWRFSYQKEPSKTAADGVVLIIGGISRV